MTTFRDSTRPDRGNDGFVDIPYDAIAKSIFATEVQQRVPFLGAGASLPSRPPDQAGTRIAPALVTQLCAALGVNTDYAKIVLEIAAKLALLIEEQANGGVIPVADPEDGGKQGSYTPS